MLIGEIIQDFRKSKEITEEEIAKFCSISTKEFEEIESEKKDINQELFQKIVEGLGIGFESYKGEIQADKQKEIIKKWTKEWKTFLEGNIKEKKPFTSEELDYLKNIEFDYAESGSPYYGYKLGFWVNSELIHFTCVAVPGALYTDKFEKPAMLKGKEVDVKKLFELFGIEERIDDLEEFEEYNEVEHE